MVLWRTLRGLFLATKFSPTRRGSRHFVYSRSSGVQVGGFRSLTSTLWSSPSSTPLFCVFCYIFCVYYCHFLELVIICLPSNWVSRWNKVCLPYMRLWSSTHVIMITSTNVCQPLACAACSLLKQVRHVFVCTVVDSPRIHRFIYFVYLALFRYNYARECERICFS